jgi:hypothetical protein
VGRAARPDGADPFRQASDSDQDFDGHRNGAALRNQVDRQMQVDIVSCGQSGSVPNRVPGALELLGAPLLDPVELVLQS